MLVDNTKNTHTNAIQTGKIVKGVLEISRKHRSTQEYLADNKSDKPKTIIIEHPIKLGWKLVETEKPIETTQTLYRFKGTVTPDKASKLTVIEEIVQGESIAILPADIGQLFAYSRTGEIPQNVKDSLIKAIQMKQAMVDFDRQIAERNQRMQEITQEQTRIRENMRTIDRQAQLYTRLLGKLNEQESEIEKLQKERDDLTKARDAKRAELEEYLGNLNVG
jgi:hypothetical protein